MSHKCAEITASTILHKPFLRKNKTRFNEKVRILSEFQQNASQHSRNDHINDIQMYSQVSSTLNVHSQVFK